MRSRLPLVVTAIALGAVVLGLAWRPAQAACLGPTVEERPSGVVDRGAEIAVEGSGWGTACHDTGAPPSGQGELGVPAAGVEVVLRQGGAEHVVAVGGADAEYRIAVRATVPPDLEPGPVELIVRTAGGAEGQDPSTAPLVISDTPAPEGATSPDPVRFGPAIPPASGPVRADGRTEVLVALVGLVVVGGALAIVLVIRRTAGRRVRVDESGSAAR